MANHEISNEVRINVKNLHFATIEEAEGEITFGTPEHIIGAEQVSRKASVSSGKLYGDGLVRFNVSKKTAVELTINANSIGQKWRSYIEGTKISSSGVESGSSEDVAKPFAIGWEVEKTSGKSEFIWFPYCIGEPIENSTQQSEDNTNFSRDTLTVVAMQHPKVKRLYTLVDQENEKCKTVTAEQFFSKVQITDEVVGA